MESEKQNSSTFDTKDFDPFIGVNQSIKSTSKKTICDAHHDIHIAKDYTDNKGSTDPLEEHDNTLNKGVSYFIDRDETNVANALFPEILPEIDGDVMVKEDLSNIDKEDRGEPLDNCRERKRKGAPLSCRQQEIPKCKRQGKRVKSVRDCGTHTNMRREDTRICLLPKDSSMHSTMETSKEVIQSRHETLDETVYLRISKGMTERNPLPSSSPVKSTPESLHTSLDSSGISTTYHDGLAQSKINKVNTSPSLDSGLESPMHPYASLTETTPSSGFGTDLGTPLSINKRGNAITMEETELVYDYLIDEPARVNLIKILQRNYKKIKSEIDPALGLADELFQAEIINQDEQEKIRSTRGVRSRSADLLIKAIACDITQLKWNQFMDALRKCGYDYIAEFLLSQTGNDYTQNKNQTDESESKKFMFLQGKFGQLKDLLHKHGFEPKTFIDDLLEVEVISFINHEDIWTTPCNEQRIEFLLRCVEKNVRNNLVSFCRILQRGFRSFAGIIDLLSKEQELLPYSDTKAVLKLSCKNGNWTLHQKGSFKNQPDIKLHIEFTTEKETGVESEVVRHHENSPNLNLEETMSKMHFKCDGIINGSIVIRLQPLSSMALKKLRGSKPEDIIAVVESLLTAENLQKLKDAKLTAIQIKIEASETSLAIPIPIKEESITKEAIVRHFTHLSKSLPNVSEFIKAIFQDKKLSEASKQNLKQALTVRGEDRNDMFLRFLLQEDTGRSRAIFRRQLRKMECTSILQILDNPSETDTVSEIKLGEDEIRMNYSYLLEELDSREFLKVFAKNGFLEDEIFEKILRSPNRHERTKLFVDFVLSSNDEARSFFFRQLESKHQAIYNVLLSTRNTLKTTQESQSMLVSMKAAICEKYAEIIEEIDPEAYKDTFVERKIFTVQEYDDLMKISLKSNRAAAFLKRLLHGDSIFALKTFLWVLRRTGSEQLAHSLENDFYMLDGEEEGNLTAVDSSQCILMTTILDARIVIDQHITDNCSEKEYTLLENPLPYWDSESIDLRIAVPHEKVIRWLQSSADEKKQRQSAEENVQPQCEATPKQSKFPDMDDTPTPAVLEKRFIDTIPNLIITEVSSETCIESITKNCTKESSELHGRRRAKSTGIPTTSCFYQHKLQACTKRRNSGTCLSDTSIQTNVGTKAANSNFAVLAGADVCQQSMNNVQTSYGYPTQNYFHEGTNSFCMPMLSPDVRREDAYSERHSNDSFDESITN